MSVSTFGEGTLLFRLYRQALPHTCSVLLQIGVMTGTDENLKLCTAGPRGADVSKQVCCALVCYAQPTE
jgi:hypothetical protein